MAEMLKRGVKVPRTSYLAELSTRAVIYIYVCADFNVSSFSGGAKSLSSIQIINDERMRPQFP